MFFSSNTPCPRSQMPPMQYDMYERDQKPYSVSAVIGLFVGMYVLYKLFLEEPSYGPYMYGTNPVMAMFAAAFSGGGTETIDSPQALDDVPVGRYVVVHMTGCPACKSLLDQLENASRKVHTLNTDSENFQAVCEKMQIPAVQYVPQCFEKMAGGTFEPRDRNEVLANSSGSAQLAHLTTTAKPPAQKDADADLAMPQSAASGASLISDSLYK